MRLASFCALAVYRAAPYFSHIGRMQSTKAAVFIQKRYPWQKYNDGDLFVRKNNAIFVRQNDGMFTTQ